MNKKLIIPLIIIFLDILGFSFILPSIPFIIEDFGGNSFHTGLIVSLTAVGMFFGAIIFGRLSDKFGRKNILLLSIFINILGYIIFGLSNNLIVFAFARFLNGLGGGGGSVLQAYIGDISNEKDKITNLGYVGASSGLGFLLGPIIGYFTIGQELHTIGYFSAILLVIAFIACLIFFKNHNQIDNNLHLKEVKFSKIFYLFFISFSITFTLIGLQTIFPFFLNRLFEMEIKQVYMIFGYIGIVAVIYQVLILRFVQKFLNEINMLKFGLISILLSLFILAFNTNIYILFVILTIFSMGFVTTNISLFSTVISHSNKKSFGNNLGLNTGFGSIGEIFGSAIAGTLFTIGLNLPFLAFGVVIFVSFLLFLLNFHE